MNAVVHRCSKPDCPVAKTGLCLEAHDPLDSCTFYGKEPVAAVKSPTRKKSAKEKRELPRLGTNKLPSGEKLTPEQIGELLLGKELIRITIIGEKDSGKTTLICSLYNRYRKGTFGDCNFAGSRTILALEKLSFYQRVESGSTNPVLPHTSIAEGLKFYHLSLSEVTTPAAHLDLVFSDRAGESYKSARDDVRAVAELTEVSQADRVVVLLDGARVADAIERASAIQNVRQMIRALIEGGALTTKSVVQVVTTKMDLLQGHAQEAAINAQLETFRRKLSEDFDAKLKSLTFSETAAEDPTGRIERAHGVDQLLKNWMIKTAHARPASVPVASLPVSSEFDRLVTRTNLAELP